jgi:cyanoexosortase A
MGYFSAKVAEINFVNYLDKRLLIFFTFCLFIVAQALSYSRSNLDISFGLTLFIFYFLALYFYYQKRATLKFSNNLLAQILGLILCSLVVIKLLTLASVDVQAFWAVAPPVMFLGLVLLADGFHGIRQFWRLLFGVVFICGLFTRIQWFIEKLVSLNVISAKISAYFLWIIGFDAVSEGSLVLVNDGIIDIYAGCTAFPLFFSSLELLIIIWLFFPKYVSNLFFYIVCAFLISFPLSIIRLAIMALVVNNASAFEFWHGTNGSNIFMSINLLTLIAIVIIRSPNDFVIDNSDISNTQLKEANSLKKSFLVTLMALIATLLLGYVIFLPYGGALKIANYQFPGQINLNNWYFQFSQQMTLKEIDQFVINKYETNQDEMITKEQFLQYQIKQINENTIMDAKRFFYKNIADNFDLNSSFYYVINANGKFPGLTDSSFSEFDPEVFQKALKNDLTSKEYIHFSDNNKNYLVSCISPTGESFIDSNSFILASRIRQILLNPVYLYQWLIGQRLMWDRRCVWVQLSIESQTANSVNHLESAWRELLAYWQQNFPAF